MFKTFSALLLVLPIVSALQLNQPTTQVRSSSPVTVTWTTTPGDPATFDLYLTNDIFRNTFALKNVVTTSDGTITVTLPVVPPGSGYTFQASPVGDVTTTLSETGVFDVGEPISSSTTSTTTTGTRTTTTTTGTTTTTPNTVTTRTPTGTTTTTSPTDTPTGSFNGNGAIGVTGIGATMVGVLVAAGAFFGL